MDLCFNRERISVAEPNAYGPSSFTLILPKLFKKLAALFYWISRYATRTSVAIKTKTNY